MKILFPIFAASFSAIVIVLISFTRPSLWYVDNLLYPIDFFVYEVDYKKIAAMESIKVAMSEEMVKLIFGEPQEISYDRYIKQTHGRRSEYNKRILNQNKCYWYSTGIDILACIIFDKGNKVIYVNVGGT